jgi:hypothetical protein
MKSPFAIFRKHQKTLVVVLIGLAMFAFIFLDQLVQSGDSIGGLPVILGAVLGAGILWIVGAQAGKPKEYAMTGAVAGAALGLVLLFAGDSGAVVKTDAGDLNARKLQDLVNRRRTANGFIQSVFQQAWANQPFASLMDPQVEPFLFNFGRPEEEDVVLGYLLNREARSLGLAVTDEAISDYLRQVATVPIMTPQNEFKQVVNLTKSDHRAILRNMRLSESELYNILREQLQARLAVQLLLPRDLRTPEQYWQYYRKVHVQQELDATAVPVDAFVDKSDPVDDATLRAFFEEHKMLFPNERAEGSPGFRQPHRVSVGYVQADYLTIEEELTREYDDDPKKAAQLEEEIEAYYELNKDRLYRKEPPKQEETSPQDRDANDKATDDAPAADPPASPDQPESKEPQTETPEGAAPETDAPADSAPSNDSPKSDESADDCDADPQDETPAPADPSADDKDSPAAPAPDAPKSDAPTADPPSADAPTTDAPADDAPTADAPAPADATDAPADAAPTQAQPADDQPIEYQELDDLLRMEIRGELLKQRTLGLMQQRIQDVQAEMRRLGLKLTLPENNEEHLTVEQATQQLRDYARKLGLGRRNEQTGQLEDSYVVTGLMSAEELHDSTEHPIGRAVEPASSQTRSPETVVQRLFRTRGEQTYLPDEAIEPQADDSSSFGDEPLTGTRYAYWKVNDAPSHVPSFEDPGIRDQVLTTWQLHQARERAKERATALKAKVEQALAQGQTMTEALASETVTGKPGDLQLTVLPTNRFSWLRLSSAAQFDTRQFQTPQLSSVDFIPKAGEEFMKAVFEELDNGEVGVAVNDDKSVYYVVQVKDRVPSGAGGEASLRQEFMEVFPIPSVQRPYVTLAQMGQRQTSYNWVVEFEKKYNVRWLRPANQYEDQYE